MNVDIDQFIRDQKSKIAEERSYLIKVPKSEINGNLTQNFNSSNKVNIKNDSFVLKMREGENMKNKYKQELRNEFSMAKQFSKHMEPYSARKENPSSDTSDDEGLLHGMRYSNSASKRKEKLRNDEYNEFKAFDEEKFRNRFSHKKSTSTDNISFIRSNPITSDIVQSHSPTFARSAIPQSRSNEPVATQPRSFGSKIDDLERKVEELRNFRIQNPYIVYPNDSSQRDDRQHQQKNLGDRGRAEESSLRYSTTNLGRSHLRYLEETEQRLKEIEDRYDSKKNHLMRIPPSGSSTKLRPILDNDEIFEQQRFVIRGEKENRESEGKSIIPTGRRDDEDVKRKKQDEYRRDLEDQMKEKSKKHRQPSDLRDNGNFFDNFGNRDRQMMATTKKKQETLIPLKIEKENDYFFYASHNPLDDFSLNPPTGNNFGSKFNDKSDLFALDLHVDERKKSGDFIFGDRDNNAKKGNYREELMRQIEESKLRKEIEKKKLEDYERRKNEEIAMYEPFGRGGGGAPLRNDKGETISDLKRIMFDPDIVKRDPPPMKEMPTTQYSPQPMEPPNSQRGFARGGNGIFGRALTDEDKVKAERYKEELQIQIEKNKRQKAVDKENERIKDENERVKFERDQKKIQMELDMERKIKQDKEFEQQRQLEESRIAALKEKEKVKKNRIIEEEKVEEERVFSPVVYQKVERRGSSRANTRSERRDSLLDKSKLEIEATQRAQLNREDSKIMSQLYKLKNQLESEKLRVEQALIRQRDEVEISDPRLTNKNSAIKASGDSEEDIFRAIVDHRKPLTFRREHLKNKSVTPRKQRNETEADLDEYLKRQEKLLERMNQKDFSKLELMMPRMEPEHVGLRPGTQMSNQLDSDSAFIRFDQSNDFQSRNPEDSDFDLGVRAAQRTPKLSANSEFGSNTSLNIDELTRKNQQRLRKLQRLQDDNDSNQSPEDILNRIVSANRRDSDLFNGSKF